MHIYGDEYQVFPCTRPPPGLPPPPPGYINYFNAFVATPSTATDGEVFASAASFQQGVPIATFWMLVLRNELQAKMLICKSDRFVVDPPLRIGPNGFYGNFQNSYQLSYSVAFPWSGNYWHNSLDFSVPLAADMAPLLEPLMNKDPRIPLGQTARAFNSSNHDDKGQNVMFGDMHAEWTKNPYQGPNNDNMYTTLLPSNPSMQVAPDLNHVGIPTGPNDIVMAPVRRSSDGAMGN
jgi:hypothetical protein